MYLMFDGAEKSNKDSIKNWVHVPLYMENELGKLRLKDWVKGWKFHTRDLKVAAKEWCEDSSATEAKYGHISEWDTSEVTSMEDVFNGGEYGNISEEAAKQFNDDISRWNVDRVESMNSLFCECESFNQDLSGWNAEKCETMERMFAGAESFNQDLTGWNIERVEDMAYMFIGAEEFDSDNIKNWDLGGRGGVFRYV